MAEPSFNIIDTPGNLHVIVSVDGNIWRIPLTREYAAYLIKQLANGLSK